MLHSFIARSSLPGSMASVMKIFADNRINIASVLQKEHHQNGKVPFSYFN